MPRSFGRIKVEVWDSGSDFRALTLEEQAIYLMLISQPTISMVGTLDYAPRKWARFAAELAQDRLEEIIAELERRAYVVADHETDELLVRSFIKHDEPWRLPNLLTSTRTAFRAVDSVAIREYLRKRHPWLLDERDGAAVLKYESTRVPTDVATDVATRVDTDVATGGALAHAPASPTGGTLADVDSDSDSDVPYVVESVSEKRRARAAPLEAPLSRSGSKASDQDDGALAVRAECPICGPLHAVPIGFDLEEHVRDVHGLELATFEREA